MYITTVAIMTYECADIEVDTFHGPFVVVQNHFPKSYLLITLQLSD